MKTPKEIKEFLNNKVLANINFTADEIISGNTPKVETISIDDFLEWFESGELIPYEFYYLKIDNYSWVIQFKEFIVDDFSTISYYYMLKIHDNTLNYDCSCNVNGWVKATPAQKQQLIDKVEGETDKVWNEDTKMFEDKPKDILVPENINIYTDNRLDPLGISFNNDLQILALRKEFSIYEVFAKTRMWEKIDCKLVPTLFSELKVGDIFFNHSVCNILDNLIDYGMCLGGGKFAFIYNNGIIIDDKPKENIYKVVPLN